MQPLISLLTLSSTSQHIHPLTHSSTSPRFTHPYTPIYTFIHLAAYLPCTHTHPSMPSYPCTYSPIYQSSTHPPQTHQRILPPIQIPTHPPTYPLTHLPTIHSRLPSHPFIYLLSTNTLIHPHIHSSLHPSACTFDHRHTHLSHSFIHPVTDSYHCFIHPLPATPLPTYPIIDQPDTIHPSTFPSS